MTRIIHLLNSVMNGRIRESFRRVLSLIFDKMTGVSFVEAVFVTHNKLFISAFSTFTTGWPANERVEGATAFYFGTNLHFFLKYGFVAKG